MSLGLGVSLSECGGSFGVVHYLSLLLFSGSLLKNLERCICLKTTRFRDLAN